MSGPWWRLKTWYVLSLYWWWLLFLTIHNRQVYGNNIDKAIFLDQLPVSFNEGNDTNVRGRRAHPNVKPKYTRREAFADLQYRKIQLLPDDYSGASQARLDACWVTLFWGEASISMSFTHRPCLLSSIRLSVVLKCEVPVEGLLGICFYVRSGIAVKTQKEHCSVFCNTTASFHYTANSKLQTSTSEAWAMISIIKSFKRKSERC